MTFKEKWIADHPDCEWVNDLGPGCPSDHGYDTEPNEVKNCKCNDGKGCKYCWDREISEESKPKGLKYQERCVIRADVRALYNKVIKDPKIEFYRGYSDSKSYGWDPEAGDYVKADGEIWFENPGYDPNYIPDVDKPRILDSGNRRQFETGAVRDIHDGKGRCDLLPLDVVAEYLNICYCRRAYTVLSSIYQFQESGDVQCLFTALREHPWSPPVDEKLGITWVRDCSMLLEVAKHFEEGCKKYGDNNWQKGIPTHCYIDSAVRHYLKYLRGDRDEPHDRAFCWNIMCCIWTCIHKPELNDYAPKEENNE